MKETDKKRVNKACELVRRAEYLLDKVYDNIPCGNEKLTMIIRQRSSECSELCRNLESAYNFISDEE